MLLRDRDENGWRIPHPGTKSKWVYHLLRLGQSIPVIYQQVGGSRNSLRVLVWKIKHPEQANSGRHRWGKTKLDQAVV